MHLGVIWTLSPWAHDDGTLLLCLGAGESSSCLLKLLHKVGPNSKNPPKNEIQKMRFKKWGSKNEIQKMRFKILVKLMAHCDFNDLTNFECKEKAMSGNRSYVYSLTLTWKNSWNRIKLTFFGEFQPFGITVLHRGRRRQRRHRRRHGHHRVLRHRRRLRTWSKISPTAIKRIWSFDEH